MAENINPHKEIAAKIDIDEIMDLFDRPERRSIFN
jgi:hypothetical protein